MKIITVYRIWSNSRRNSADLFACIGRRKHSASAPQLSSQGRSSRRAWTRSHHHTYPWSSGSSPAKE
jgi:hypothetical protein